MGWDGVDECGRKEGKCLHAQVLDFMVLDRYRRQAGNQMKLRWTRGREIKPFTVTAHDRELHEWHNGFSV